MSQSLTDRQADRWTSALGLLTSITYVLQARTLEDSLLADGVGVAGVPIAVGSVMVIACLALLLKTLVVRSTAQATDQLPEVYAATPKAWLDANHAKAAGLLAILVVYVSLLPVFGYVVSIGLLVGAVAWFAGARQHTTTILCMVLSGPLMWLVFDWALKIRLPIGLWLEWGAR